MIIFSANSQDNLNNSKFNYMKSFQHQMYIEQQVVHQVMNITNNKLIM